MVSAGIKKKVVMHGCRVSNGDGMTYLKHKDGKGKRSVPAAKKREQEPVRGGIQYLDVNGLDDLAEAMNKLASAAQGYAHNATIGENSLELFSGSESSGYRPVRLVLEGEAVEGIADSLKRIADALAANRG